MRNLLFLLFTTLFLGISCVSVPTNSPKFLKDAQATYTPYTNSDATEKGYQIELKFKKRPTMLPKFLVFKGYKIAIKPNKIQQTYNLYLPTQSSHLMDFSPVVSSLPNGIIFEKKEEELLFPIKFVKTKN